MACQVHTWSMNGLVAAFLNLAIAYVFLCLSAVAFFTSKFLGFFGLKLPCPCDRMLSNIPRKDYCLNRLLVDFPAQQVSNVELSVKQRFPFNDFIWARHQNNNIDVDNRANGILEIEGDASCSSASNARKSRNLVGREFGQWEEEYDVKGKGVINHRPRSRLRRRSRKGVVDHGKYSSLSCYEPSLCEEFLCSIPHSHSSSIKGGKGISRRSSLGVGSGGAYHTEYKQAPSVVGTKRSSLSGVLKNNSSNDDDEIKKTGLSIEDLHEAESFCGQEGNAIRPLEQALEDKNSACDALYIELEKERNAAASAADEAMAMILRLQEEKASIEMEARQYQRIIEEKSAYDAEEIDILKEILLRRETEIYFLEKEVEAYRQIVSLRNRQLVKDGLDLSGAPQNLFGLVIDPNEDPVLLLRQLSASTEKKLMTENRCSNGAVTESPVQDKNEKYIFRKQENQGVKSIQMVGAANVGSIDLWENDVVPTDNSLYLTPTASLESNFLENIVMERKELAQNEELNLGHKLDETNSEVVDEIEASDLCHVRSLKRHEEEVDHESNSSCDLFGKNSRVYDVHVVADGISFCKDEKINKSEHLSVSKMLKADETSVPFEAPLMGSVDINTDCPSTNGSHAEVNVKRSSSDAYYGLPPVVLKGTSMLSDLRRSSTSIVESEMLKIDGEVGQLLERLRVVKEGRDKLAFNLENRKRENVQLKLLGDIATQVQEIRHSTEPGSAVRHVSLPLPTSKVLSKKKRCRSISSGVQRSS